MKSKIAVLPETLINQIAAGEVIENPASVVKEFVDNSLDAGATRIRVEIQAGGLHLIRVDDNGSGMTREEAQLSLERHATSKLRSVDDLHHLLTMGFRGEALPSIASISHLTMMTRPAEEEEGTLLCVQGGEQKTLASITCEAGTSLEVKQLFYNVPARRKFVKSPAANAREVLRMITQLSLAYPDREFTLVHNQEKVFFAPLPPKEMDPFRARVESVLGERFLDKALVVEWEKNGYRMEGWVGFPTENRPNRKEQILILNQRPVVIPLIAEAVREGYGTALPPQRFPTFVLRITLPPENVDINVHPQKKEVRLQYQPFVREWVMEGIQHALQGAPVPEVEPIPLPSFSPVFETPPEPIPEEVKQWSWQPQTTMPQREEVELPLMTPTFLGSYPPFVLWESVSLTPFFPDWTKEGIALMDVRAVRRRILFEQYQKQMQANKKGEAQRLLFPLALEGLGKLFDERDNLETLGFSLEKEEENLLANAIPAGWNEKEAEHFLREFASEQNSLKGAEERKKEELLARLASQCAVVEKKERSQTEAIALLKQLRQCQQPLFCPRGQPTLVLFSKEEVEKKFQ